MRCFKVTEDRRVFLNGVEVHHCTGYQIIANAGDDPEVVLRAVVDKIEIEGYTDLFSKQNDETHAYLAARKEALQAIRSKADLKDAQTCDLVTELISREGVDVTIAEPYQDAQIKVSGPAIVLVVID